MFFRFFLIAILSLSVSIFSRNKCSVRNYYLYSNCSNFGFFQPNQNRYQLIEFGRSSCSFDASVNTASRNAVNTPILRFDFLADFLGSDVVRKISLINNHLTNANLNTPSDAVLLARYVTQSVSLLSYLLPLYFYDPRNTNESTKYLLASTLLSFALFPTAFFCGASLMEMSISNGYGPMIYIFGLLGTVTGLSIPLLLNRNGSVSDGLHSMVPLTCGFIGCVSGSFFTFLLPENHFTYQKSVLIFSSSFAGMVTGVVISKIKKEHAERSATAGILLGGWNGLLIGFLLKRTLNEQAYFSNGNLSMKISLPVITNIPLLTILHKFPKMKYFSVRLFLLDINY